MRNILVIGVVIVVALAAFFAGQVSPSLIPSAIPSVSSSSPVIPLTTSPSERVVAVFAMSPPYGRTEAFKISSENWKVEIETSRTGSRIPYMLKIYSINSIIPLTTRTAETTTTVEMITEKGMYFVTVEIDSSYSLYSLEPITLRILELT